MHLKDLSVRADRVNEDTPTADAKRRALAVLEASTTVLWALAALIAAGVIAATALQWSAAHAQHRSVSVPFRRIASTPTTPVSRRVGVSVRGRPILAASFGSGQRRVLVIGGIHGSEFGSDVAEAWAAWLGAHPADVPAGTRVDIVACANPDGRAAGKKGNAHAVNLNGNFPTRNWKRQRYRTTTAGPRPGSEPETQAIMRLLDGGYVRVISLHSQGGVIDYDGPGGLEIANQVALASAMPVKKLGPSTLYAGSLGTYVPERFGIPVLTFELSSRTMTPSVLAGLLASVR
jgi:murein peptide amidase A